MQDKLMPILVVDDPEMLEAFYTAVLGFERGMSITGEKGATLTVYSYGSSNVGIAAPGSLAGLPPANQGVLLVIEMMDVEGSHRVMSARAERGVGPVQEAFIGRYFDVTDPVGHVFRFLETSDAIRDGSVGHS